MEEMINILLRLLTIDSPSGEEAEISRFIRSEMQGYGLDVQADEIGNLITCVPGDGEALLLIAHMDNVPPCKGVRPVIEGDVIHSDGSTVLGADDKAGIAVILAVLRELQGSQTPHLPLDIVFSVREETALEGVKALSIDRLQAKRAICLDGSGAATSVVIASPTSIGYQATIQGKAAFPGLGPQPGIDAIRIAAKAIAEMTLGLVDEDTIANIGLIRGGEAVNVVPEHANFKGIVRGMNRAFIEQQVQRMNLAVEQAASHFGGRVEVNIEENYPGYVHSPDVPILQKVQQVMRKLGFEPDLVRRWGGTDGNVLNAKGIQTVNLGVGYLDHHSSREKLLIPEMRRCYQIVSELIKA